ncbi:MAG: LamG-like jellyroll fold domain-containing protein, partial [Bacteroidota bacterium]
MGWTNIKAGFQPKLKDDLFLLKTDEGFDQFDLTRLKQNFRPAYSPWDLETKLYANCPNFGTNGSKAISLLRSLYYQSSVTTLATNAGYSEALTRIELYRAVGLMQARYDQGNHSVYSSTKDQWHFKINPPDGARTLLEDAEITARKKAETATSSDKIQGGQKILSSPKQFDLAYEDARSRIVSMQTNWMRFLRKYLPGAANSNEAFWTNFGNWSAAPAYNFAVSAKYAGVLKLQFPKLGETWNDGRQSVASVGAFSTVDFNLNITATGGAGSGASATNVVANGIPFNTSWSAGKLSVAPAESAAGVPDVLVIRSADGLKTFYWDKASREADVWRNVNDGDLPQERTLFYDQDFWNIGENILSKTTLLDQPGVPGIFYAKGDEAKKYAGLSSFGLWNNPAAIFYGELPKRERLIRFKRDIAGGNPYLLTMLELGSKHPLNVQVMSIYDHQNRLVFRLDEQQKKTSYKWNGNDFTVTDLNPANSTHLFEMQGGQTYTIYLKADLGKVGEFSKKVLTLGADFWNQKYGMSVFPPFTDDFDDNLLAAPVPNVVVTSGSPSGVGGVMGNFALEFDGGEKVLLTKSPLDGKADFTIAAWVKTGAQTGKIFTHAADKTLSLGLENGKLVFANGSLKVTGTTNIADGNWHYVTAIRKANGTVTLHTDITQTGTGSGGTSVSPSTSAALGEGFTGQLEEVSIWGSALTQEQIADAMLNGVNATLAPPAKLAYFDFNNEKGLPTLSDKSGSGSNGELSGMEMQADWVAVTLPTFDQTPGDYSLSFSGNNSKITFAAAPLSGKTAFTIGCWVKTTALSGDLYRQGDANGMRLRLAAGKLTFSIGATAISTAKTINDGNWHYVAASRAASGTVTLTIDCGWAVSSPLQGSGVATATISAIGEDNFKGQIEEMLLWERALTQSEIIAYLRNETSQNINLITRYDFNDGTAKTTLTNRQNPTAAKGNLLNFNYLADWVKTSGINKSFAGTAAISAFRATEDKWAFFASASDWQQVRQIQFGNGMLNQEVAYFEKMRVQKSSGGGTSGSPSVAGGGTSGSPLGAGGVSGSIACRTTFPAPGELLEIASTYRFVTLFMSDGSAKTLTLAEGDERQVVDLKTAPTAPTDAFSPMLTLNKYQQTNELELSLRGIPLDAAYFAIFDNSERRVWLHRPEAAKKYTYTATGRTKESIPLSVFHLSLPAGTYTV